MNLTGKIALLTGGTGELGRALTKRFIAAGADVIVTYRSESDVPQFMKEFPGVLMLKGDLSKEKDVQDIFATLLEKKKIVHIVCNLVGGYMPKKDITDLEEREWEFMFALNLKTCFLCSKSALRIMRKNKYGRIINVSAMAGLSPGPGRGAYGIAKAGVATFTHIAGEEAKSYFDSDITVNAIAPSILLTAANKQSASKEESVAWVTLDEAANVVLFLASDEASAINGQTVRIYGGV
jgi:3-oxoacyl-[acyl-carrier protein] reductase